MGVHIEDNNLGIIAESKAFYFDLSKYVDI